MRCFCRVEYIGTAYSGWQIQKNAKSIQSELESAFSTVVREPCRVMGAGRTDAGVHARNQGMHTDLPDNLDLKKCELSVNAVLPRDIAIYNLQRVENSFHARFSAIERCYKYYIITRKMPLWHERAHKITFSVDWQMINENLSCLLGSHDFTAFCAAGSNIENNVCDIKNVKLEYKNQMYIFTITADRFIYKMVRSIVGTLIDIGRGNITDSLDTILKTKNRNYVGDTVPSCGLVLEYVLYEKVR